MFMAVRAQHPPNRSRKKRALWYNLFVAANRNPLAWLAMICVVGAACDAEDEQPTAAGDGDGDSIDAGDAGDAGGEDRSACDAGELAMTFYEDSDGDGFGIPGLNGIRHCVDEAPRGFSENARDCDDTDATKHIERYRDDDADGYGQATAICVGETDPGYIFRNDDCDDTDAARSPAGTETWFDGTDSNCDGLDNPGSCISGPGLEQPAAAVDRDVMSIPPLDQLVIERDESCDGADLYFAILGACHTCSGGFATFVIGNRGTQATEVHVETDLSGLDLDVALEPQHASEPMIIELRPPNPEVRVSTRLGGTSDCDLDNNARTVKLNFTECQ